MGEEKEVVAEEVKAEEAAPVVEEAAPVVEEVAPVVEAPKVSEEDKLAKAIDGLKEALRPQLSPEQRAEQVRQLEESTGLSEKALRYMSSQIQSNQMGLEAVAELGKMKAEKALGAYSDALLKDVEEEMAKLPANVQGNPKAWEEMAYLVKGKKMDKVTPRATERKIVNPNLGNVSGTRSSAPVATGSSKKYSDDERKLIAIYHEGKPEEYERWKSEKTTNVSERYERPTSGGNAADAELARITGQNS